MNGRAVFLATRTLIASAIIACVASFVACTGSPTKPPDGSFKFINAAHSYACGVQTDGAIECWGVGTPWEPIPNGSFQSVDPGASQICAVRQDASITCWWHRGYSSLPAGILPPKGTFKQVVTGFRSWFNCALRSDGAFICWKDDTIGPIHPTVVEESGTLKSISRTSRAGICGIRSDDTVTCWGALSEEDRLPSVHGRFKSVSAGYTHACGIRFDNTVNCWGDGRDGRTSAPRGQFSSVTAGFDHTCGIRIDKSIECWGNDEDEKTRAPSGTFIAISAGSTYTCAIRTDGTVTCWGRGGKP